MNKLYRSDENHLIHFIWACYTHQGSRPVIYKLFEDQMHSRNMGRAILTVVHRWRYSVVTKEIFEDLYKHGGTLGYENLEKSLGDEIEDFYDGIKNNRDITTSLFDNQDKRTSVHCSILSAQESRRLSEGDEIVRSSFCVHYYQNPDVSDEDMLKSESTFKYAASICIRRSYNISPF